MKTIAEFLKTHPYKTAEVNGHSFRYLLCGQGKETLMLLTGGLGVSELWMNYIEALELDFQVLTFDYPMTLETNNALASGIVDLMAKLGIEKANVIGSSYGGYLAQVLAAEHPSRVSSLSLFSTAAITQATLDGLREKYEKSVPILMWMFRHVPYGLMKPIFRKSCMKHTENATAEEKKELRALFKDVFRDYTAQFDIHMTGLLADIMNLRPTTKADFAYLRGRVLLILPENDNSFTEAMQKDLVNMMSNPKVVSGIDSGHLSTTLRVDQYVSEIRNFISEIV